MRSESKSRRAQVALVLGCVGGFFTMMFYIGIAISVFSQGKVSQSEEFLLALQMSLILALIPALGAYVLTRRLHYEDIALEKRRVTAFQLGIVSIALTGWIPLGAILAWLLLPYS